MNNPGNVIFQHFKVGRPEHEKLNGHRSCVLWFTGFSGSGKSTLAGQVQERLMAKRIHTYLLDGDNIRHGLNSNLDFSPEGRTENIRRIGEVAKLFSDAGIVTLTAFISPFRKDRDNVRNLLPKNDFIEVYVNCPIEVCEQRDVKGLYKKARTGEIAEFTGISSPFEPPPNPEIEVRTNEQSVEQCVNIIVDFVLTRIL
ncbi:MAG: adenylyl-sulfate kinase [Bacteroidia bacterium]|nr:adenylyl-sulfate kinase [Bacteroidia bacterium]MCZ2276999.1 adenylyl-sulfate kinase [Bacteroidia bacterium]